MRYKCSAKEATSNLWVELRTMRVDVDAVEIQPVLDKIEQYLATYGNHQYNRGIEDAAKLMELCSESPQWSDQIRALAKRNK